MNKVTLVILFAFCVLSGQSQKVEIGGDLGYVASDLSANGFQISLGTYFYPKHSIFLINPGLSYQRNDHWNFIKLPLGIVFTPGRNVRFLIGSGVSLNYEFTQPKYPDVYSVASVRDFSLNLFVLVGVSLNINDRWSVFIKPQFDLGLTTLYTSSRHENSYLENKSSSLSLNIGVKYLIFQKLNKADMQVASMRGK